MQGRTGWAAWTVIAGLLLARASSAATLEVGPGKTYATPCAAIAAARDGDTIEIDAAGTYDGDVCGIPKNGLTLKGVNGRAKIDAAGKNSGGKGIWVISGNDTTVENIEFSGATVPDQNGAGIRQEGSNLTVRGCYFHDNDDGILSGGKPDSQIVIEYSEFANNGFGDGYSHNMYIGHEGRFTLRYSYSHDARFGHLVKSRAAENLILYNRLTGERGTSSYELDLPNGGISYVIGNVIEQGPATENSGIITYGLEGAAPENPGHELFVVNNTIVNGRPAGATFVNVGAAMGPAFIKNNVFVGGGTITNQATAVQATNWAMGDPMFVDAAGYDFHLRAGSPCIDAGRDPGTGAGVSLLPTKQYVHPARAEGRTSVGAIDIGAFELGGETDAGAPATGSGGAGGAGGASPGAGGANTATGAAGIGGVTGPGGTSSATSASATGGGGGSAAAGASDGGCGCRMGASGGSHRWVGWLAASVVLGSRARRRPRRARGETPR